MTKETKKIIEEYERKFGYEPSVCFGIGLDWQAEWWKECIRRDDPETPIDEGYDAVLKELPIDAVI